MVKFYYRDIKVEAIVKMTRSDFKDSNNIGRTRFDRNVSVTVAFWNFIIENNLYELALIKSTLNYYMQSYWKRSSKQGQKIDLATSLSHNDTMQKLNLVARQKNNKHSLEVSLTYNGQQCECFYFSAQEVIMIDVAVSKAISLLMPDVVNS
ncbi:MAG: hypothetical protein RBT80_23880 [Candidatus Vecturithrix sp.]|jgi:hypothetical protein|nr:hypothetical protein [Candidatus Vecturithrix sp.]